MTSQLARLIARIQAWREERAFNRWWDSLSEDERATRTDRLERRVRQLRAAVDAFGVATDEAIASAGKLAAAIAGPVVVTVVVKDGEARPQ